MAGTMRPVLGQPPRAPHSRPVDPGARAPGMGEGTTATGKPTGAPGATGLDQEARHRGTLPATTTTQDQVPSNNSHGVP